MIDDPFPVFEYLSQKQLGVLFGVSSHVVGKWLRELGLRTADAKPSPEAIRTGLAQAVILTDGIVSFFAWDKKRVVKLFEEAGHSRSGLTTGWNSSPVTLKGPFTLRSNGGDGFELLGGDGLACIWTRGQGNAEMLARVLNIVHKFRSQKLPI